MEPIVISLQALHGLLIGIAAFRSSSAHFNKHI
jgi:hypothetical protein